MSKELRDPQGNIVDTSTPPPAKESVEGLAEKEAKEYANDTYCYLPDMGTAKSMMFSKSDLLFIANKHFLAGYTAAKAATPSVSREWVKIEDGLPKKSGQVLGCMKDTLSVYVCYYRGDRGFQVWGLGRKQPITDMKVTHWMPLPDTPTEVALPASLQSVSREEGKGLMFYIHKGIEFSESEAIKNPSEAYRSGAGFGYSCGYQDGEKLAAPVSDAVEVDAISFTEWTELNGYRIKGMDDTQRHNIYNLFLTEKQKV